MSTSLPPVAASTSPLQSFSPSISRWNARTVTVLLGIGLLGLAIYAVYRRYCMGSTTAARRPPDQDEVNFTSRQHSSDLSYHGQLSVNERKPLTFEHFAEGIIQFNRSDFDPGFFKHTGELFVIHFFDVAGSVFFTQVTNADNDLQFFVPNLPLDKKIGINFGSLRTGYTITSSLAVRQPRGQYAIFRHGENYLSRSEALPAPTQLIPDFYERPIPLSNPLAFKLLSTGAIRYTTPSTDASAHVLITNLGQRSIVYIQLVSQNPDIKDDERAVVLPFVINAGKTQTFSLDLLNIIWRDVYHNTTGKENPTNDLDLHLRGLQIKIYPPAPEGTERSP